MPEQRLNSALERKMWSALSNRFLKKLAIETEYELESIVGTTEELVPDSALETFRVCGPSDTQELAHLLLNVHHRLFVKLLIFKTKTVPEPLFTASVLAGAMTANPSFNKHFIWPCVLCFGRRRVLTELLRICQTGTNTQKAGAAEATYWATTSRNDLSWGPAGVEWNSSENADESVSDLMDELASWAVGEFVCNANIDVQRSLVSYLPRALRFSPEAAQIAIKIALNHPDDFIRSRTKVDLGQSNVYPMKPKPV
jgi:hypothetical protein